MAAGIIITQSDMNNMIGGLARTINAALSYEVPNINQTIARLGGSSGIIALPTGGLSPALVLADANMLNSAMDVLNKLASVYTGNSIVVAGSSPGTGIVQAGNGYDFRPYPSNVWGFGF